MGQEANYAAVVIAFMALSFLSTLARCISRFAIVKKAGPDDFLTIGAFFILLSMTVFNLLLVMKEGLGSDPDLHSATALKAIIVLKYVYIGSIHYTIAICFVKISILCQYLRFFVEKHYLIAAWTLLGFNSCWSTSLLFISIFSCRPISYFWDKSLHGKCINPGKNGQNWIIFSVINIITDLAIFILPLPVLYTLRMPKRQKISLFLVFTFGAFGCLTSILRLSAFFGADMLTDFDNYILKITKWSQVELCVGLICSCIPATKALVRLMMPLLLGSTKGGTNSDPFSRMSAHPYSSTVELSRAEPTPNTFDKGFKETMTEDQRSVESLKDSVQTTEARTHAWDGKDSTNIP